jgi:hypothetical protein
LACLLVLVRAGRVPVLGAADDVIILAEDGDIIVLAGADGVIIIISVGEVDDTSTCTSNSGPAQHAAENLNPCSP